MPDGDLPLSGVTIPYIITRGGCNKVAINPEHTTDPENRELPKPLPVTEPEDVPEKVPDSEVREEEEERREPREEPRRLTFQESLHLRNVALGGLLVLAVLYTLVIAKAIILPVVLGLLFTFIFRPIHARFLSWGLPPVVGAALILVLLAGTIGATAWYLYAPVGTWMARIPTQLEQVESRMQELMRPVEKVQEVAQQVDEIAEGEGGRNIQVDVQPQSVSDTIWAYSLSFAGYTGLTLGMLFFMLAYGDRVVRTITRHYESEEVFDEVTQSVSGYLLTVTLINMALGVATGVAMWLLNMPNPILWGVMAFLFNYIPFLGAMVGTMIVGLAAILTFEGSLVQMIAPPAVFLGLTMLEGNFITPVILGQQFTVNPLIIFIWLIAWGWLWGIPGAVLAVPFLMALRIVLEHLETTRPVADIISYKRRHIPKESAAERLEEKIEGSEHPAAD